MSDNTQQSSSPAQTTAVPSSSTPVPKVLLAWFFILGLAFALLNVWHLDALQYHKTLFNVLLAGAFGATLRTLHGTVTSRKGQQNYKTDHICNPIIGAGCAVIFVYALKTGLLLGLTLGENSAEVRYIVLASLCGFAFSNAMQKIRVVCQELFRTEPKP